MGLGAAPDRTRTVSFSSPPRTADAPPPLQAPRTPDADERWRRGFRSGSSRAANSCEHTGSPLRRAASAGVHAAYAVDISLVSPAFQALLPALSGDPDTSDQLVNSCCQRLGVAPDDLALFEMRPLPPGAPPPPGARVAVALRSSSLSLASIEALLQERAAAHAAAEDAQLQLQAARAELQRERAARLQAQAACDAMRFHAALPPAAQLERLRLDGVAVGGAALVSLASLPPPNTPRMFSGGASGAAALAERADCAPAHAHAPCRFTRV